MNGPSDRYPLKESSVNVQNAQTSSFVKSLEPQSHISSNLHHKSLVRRQLFHKSSSTHGTGTDTQNEYSAEINSGSSHRNFLASVSKKRSLTSVSRSLGETDNKSYLSGHGDHHENVSLRDWKRQWRQIMSVSKFYFDCVDENSKDHVKGSLTNLGSRIHPFFEADVTHVVTKRTTNQSYGPNDVLTKAKSLGMKIWTYEKLLRFLTNLLGTSSVSSKHNFSLQQQSQSAKQANLSNLLQEEKLSGPADRDPKARRDDYYYFKGPYVLVWDVSKRNRNTLEKEFARVTNASEGDWPQFRLSSIGHCPFIFDPLPHNNEDNVLQSKAPQHEVQKDKMRANKVSTAISKVKSNPYLKRPNTAISGEENDQDAFNERPRNKLVKVSPEETQNNVLKEVAQNKLNQRKSNENDEPTEMNNNDLPVAFSANSRNNSELSKQCLDVPYKSSISATSSATASIRANSTTTTTRFSEIMASGVNMSTLTSAVKSVTQSGDQQGTANGLSAIKAQVTSRQVDNLKKMLERKRFESFTAKEESKSLSRDQKPGFCENCKEKFDNFNDHVKSRRHRKFALDNENFAELDRILNSFARPLRPNYDQAD